MIDDLEHLLSRCALSRGSIGDLEGARAAERLQPVRVTEAFLGRVEPGAVDDPLLMQVLPSGRELEDRPGFEDDPLREADALAGPGVLRKYRGRILIEVTGACAMHCRYCFRRHRAGRRRVAPLRGRRLEQVISLLAGDASVHEVILSGGDPLMEDDQTLAQLAEQLAKVRHLRRLRIHTRVPVAEPSRIDDGLLSWLTGTRLHPVVVLHCNHARELDDAVRQSLRRLTGRGVTLLNQSVLLAGVNDSAQVLAELSEALAECLVTPYYLHLLDTVRGAAAFEVGEPEALALQQALRERLPGYLVPRMVREVPGAAFKLPMEGCGAPLARQPEPPG